MPYALLEDRGFLAVTGEQAAKILDGLFSQTLFADFQKTPILYGFFANPAGNVLTDAMIQPIEGGFLLECHADLRDGLGNYIRERVLYSHIEVKPVDPMQVSVLWEEADARVPEHLTIEDLIEENWHFTAPYDVLIARDPRHHSLGWRIYTYGVRLPEGAASPDDYRVQRWRTGAPEAPLEIACGASLAQKRNLDLLRAIHWSGKCYIGQEVIARVQHRGEVRKRCFPFRPHSSADGMDILFPVDEDIMSLTTFDSPTIGRVLQYDPERRIGLAEVSILEWAFGAASTKQAFCADSRIVIESPHCIR